MNTINRNLDKEEPTPFAIRRQTTPKAEALPSQPTIAALKTLAGLQMLIVDDEEDLRDLLTKVLEHYGAKVAAVASAAEALEAIKQMHPDVLICDISMPEEDGYELIRQVRALGPEQGGQVPAVALTAFTRLEDRQRALSAGYHMHIPKTVEPTELVAILASLTNRVGKA